MTEKLGVCIVGCGGIARLHADSCLSRDPSIALYGFDVNRAAAESLMGRFGGAVIGDYEEVLRREDIAVVDICVPHHVHREVAVAALEAGKHVLLEKPLAATLEECDAILAAAANAPGKFMVAECWRFYEPAVKAAELIAQGVLGEVFFVQANSLQYYSPPGWRAKLKEMGGGAFLDRGVHFVHLARWLGGGVVTSVAAHTTHATIPAMEGEDTGTALLHFASGAVGQVNVSWGMPGAPPAPNLAVFGSEGTAYDLGGLYLHRADRLNEPPEKVAESRLEPVMIPVQVRHFIDCVREGGEVAVPGDMARADVEVVVAAYRSAECGETVRLPVA